MPKEKNHFIYRRSNPLSYFEHIRPNGKLCDFTIQTNTKSFKVHKIVLGSIVPYFEKIFTSDCKEQKDGVAVLNNIKPKNMCSLIKFAYAGKIELNKDNAESLMFDADFLGLTELADECVKILGSHIDSQNVWRIQKSAKLFKFGDVLQEKCRNYILENFLNFERTEQFLQIPVDELEKIIKSQGLQVASEERVYTAMMRWLKHDVNERKEYLPVLLKCVRLANIPAEYLINDVLKDELIATSQECKDIVNAVIYLKEKNMLNEIKPRDCEVAGSKHRIIVCSRDSSMLMYNPITDSWEVIKTIFTQDISPMAVLKGKLYAIDRIERSSSKCIIVYNPNTCSWKEIGKVKNCRFSFQMIGLGDYLFICGGMTWHPKSMYLNLVERYCPQTGEWKTMAPMNIGRSDFAAVVYQGCIYVCGGRGETADSHACLASIECYNPSTDKWTIVDTSLKGRRAFFGMAVFNNKIYICGGSNDDTTHDATDSLNTVEVYDPKSNTCKSIASMKHDRMEFVFVPYQERLWAIGGWTESDFDITSVELYDPETNSWQYGKSLPDNITSVAFGGMITID